MRLSIDLFKITSTDSYMKIKYIIVLFLFLAINVRAQQTNKSRVSNLNPKIRSLRIGDKVPEILMGKIINYKAKSAHLTDFKNQLLILDFWDTYCSSCIEALPKLDAMQRKFSNRIKILPVTWQKENEVRQFFKTNRFLKNQKIPVSLPSIVEDKLLASYFRHQIISHEVWIYNGVVKAITSPEYVNAKNIQMILDGKHVDWPEKNDAIEFDMAKPLLTLNYPEQYNKKNTFFSYSVLTGQRDGLNKTGGINFNYDSLGHTYKLSIYNKSIIDMYKLLLFNVDSVRKEFIITPGRLILEVKDSSKYVYKPESGLLDIWSRENQICYEMLYSKPVSQVKMIKMALKDLDSRLGLHGRWEKRKIKCLVFVRNKKKNITDSLEMTKEGMPIPMIAFFKLDNTGKYPPAIDETNFKGNIPLGEYDGTLNGLRNELQKSGFDLIEAERMLDVLVITDI